MDLGIDNSYATKHKQRASPQQIIDEAQRRSESIDTINDAQLFSNQSNWTKLIQVENPQLRENYERAGHIHDKDYYLIEPSLDNPCPKSNKRQE